MSSKYHGNVDFDEVGIVEEMVMKNSEDQKAHVT